MVKINITRWRLDTCGCVVEYSWDAGVPAEQRVHTPHKTVKDCPEHSGLTKEQLYNVLIDENTRKNNVWGKLIENDRIGEDIVKENGRTVRQMKRGIMYDWNFDADRNLEVRLLGITQTTKEKSDLQAFCNTTFGTDKVKVL